LLFILFSAALFRSFAVLRGDFARVDQLLGAACCGREKKERKSVERNFQASPSLIHHRFNRAASCRTNSSLDGEPQGGAA